MTETETQALTEFLLARIAEDGQPTTHRRPHALAECEAKREIVDLAAFAQASAPYEMPKRYMRLTLKFLAMPYVDHPDYRPEWRP